MKERFGITILALCLILGLASCSKDEEIAPKNTSLSSESLQTIIETSRGESDNKYYSVVYGDADKEDIVTDLALLGLTNEMGIKHYAISTPGANSNDAYAVAIVETSKTDDVKKTYKEFAEGLSEDLYIEHYDKSQIAKDYKLGTLYDYSILVISSDADSIYDEIENKIIESVSAD